MSLKRVRDPVWNEFSVCNDSTVVTSVAYGSVTCNHCAEAAVQAGRANTTTVISGRPRDMKRHLASCLQYSIHNKRTPIIAIETTAHLCRSSSSSSQSSYAVAAQTSTPMDRYLDRDFTPAQRHAFHILLLEFVADAALPFNIYERETFQAIIRYVRSAVVGSIPSGKVMSGVLLVQRARLGVDETLPKMAALVKAGACLSYISDGWENISKDHVEGNYISSFILPYNHFYLKSQFIGTILKLGELWFCVSGAHGKGNVSDEDNHDVLSTAEMMEKGIIYCEKEYCLPVSCVCTDQAGQCGMAKRILALRYPSKAFTKCFAHQVSLIVKHVLRIDIFQQTASIASDLVSFFRNSPSKWMIRLNREMMEMYGKRVKLQRLMEVRWNSVQVCFASLLQVRSAIMTVIARYSQEWPSRLRLNESTWQAIEDAEKTIRPLCVLSYR
jgi:hypothetical protein